MLKKKQGEKTGAPAGGALLTPKNTESENVKIKKIVYGSPEYKQSLNFRNEIFRKPQGMDIKDDDLEYEKEAEMYGAWLGAKLIATVFLQNQKNGTARIRAMAVESGYRNSGLGKTMMNFIEKRAAEKGFKKICLSARKTAQGFYEKLGYKTAGGVILYKTVPHIEMEKIP